MKRLWMFLILSCLAAPLGADDSAKGTYLTRVAQEIDELSDKVESLRSRSEQAGERTRTRIKKQIDRLDTNLKKASEKVGDAQKSSESHWEGARRSLDQTMDRLRAEYERLQGRFQK